jgi:hypothetical protein
MYVSHCIELDTDTWAPTLEEARTLTSDMIETYFLMADKLGTRDKILAQIVATQAAPNPDPATHDRWRAMPVYAQDGSAHFSPQFEVSAAA